MPRWVMRKSNRLHIPGFGERAPDVRNELRKPGDIAAIEAQGDRFRRAVAKPATTSSAAVRFA
jgi:hypothetical protein